MNVDQLISMGGYGLYVWTAYGITLSVFAINIGLVFLEKARVKKISKHYLLQVGSNASLHPSRDTSLINS
jgi:heme exporter protein CcmD